MVAGVCALDIDVTFTPAIPAAVPGRVEVDLDGGGMCRLHDTNTYAASLDGVGLDPPLTVGPNFECAGGSVVGNVDLLIPGYTSNPVFSGTAHVVATAGVVTMVVASEEAVPEFAAVGTFVPAAEVDCPTMGLGSTTWSGKLEFEDPTVV